MPTAVITRLFGRHFRHHSRRPPLLVLVGMVSILVTLCYLFAAPIPAVKSLLFAASPAMTSFRHPHSPPEAVAEGGGQRDFRPNYQDSDLQKTIIMEYGTSARPPLFDLPDPLMVSLAPEHTLPPPSPDVDAFGKKVRRRRLVFVGDIHGHLHELKALLQKVEFDHKNGDHLVLVGDIVAKGPDSAGVVNLAIEVSASGVRGNHEDLVLLAHKAMEKKKKHHHHKAGTTDQEDPIPSGDEADEELSAFRSKHANHARAVARSLSAKQLKWLSSLPVILRIGAIPGATNTPWNASEVVVVHAGLVPNVPLEKQDPWAMMNMRTLIYPGLSSETLPTPEDEIEEGDTTSASPIVAVPSDTRNGEPWSHAWNRFQNDHVRHPEDRTVVIYGHDAKKGLQTSTPVVIKPHPAEKSKKKKHHARGDTDGDGSGGTAINIEIAPELEVESDGDVEVEVETEIEIEVENEGEGDDDGTDDGASGEDKDKEVKRDVEAKGKRQKRSKKMKRRKGTRYAFGLDSGCGHGRQLTALVVEAPRADGFVAHRIEQVDCTSADE
ncbi:hypothetical protein OQA88_6347 [Cercophora sp. LCS_1]